MRSQRATPPPSCAPPPRCSGGHWAAAAPAPWGCTAQVWEGGVAPPCVPALPVPSGKGGRQAYRGETRPLLAWCRAAAQAGGPGDACQEARRTLVRSPHRTAPCMPSRAASAAHTSSLDASARGSFTPSCSRWGRGSAEGVRHGWCGARTAAQPAAGCKAEAKPAGWCPTVGTAQIPAWHVAPPVRSPTCPTLATPQIYAEKNGKHTQPPVSLRCAGCRCSAVQTALLSCWQRTPGMLPASGTPRCKLVVLCVAPMPIAR